MSESQPSDTRSVHRVSCPNCQQIVILEEIGQTLHCPHCSTESPLPPPSPLLVAALLTHPDEAEGLDLRGYELIEPVGKGGMGEVYRAADPALGRDLAIKVMKERYREAPQAERRFLREARITGSLQHPGIVPIYNLGRLADGRLHYTMRLVRGRTLADILKEEAGKAEHWPELLTIFVKICQAVAYAHSKLVIHRDLKPANVMVGRFGEVQVMDWGLAKLLPAAGQAFPSDATEESTEEDHAWLESGFAEGAAKLTRTGAGIGTPSYMPVEQALGQWDRVDERADVFALGAILCEILTGASLHAGYAGEEVIHRAQRGETTEMLERLADCGADAALTALCRECLSAERDSRPRDAGVVGRRVADYQAEVQARLQRAEVERTRALGKAEAARKQRRWAFALVFLAVAASLLVGWQAVRSSKLADAEAEQRRQAEANARQAEQSKKDTEAVLGFFQDKVLAAGRPQGQAGGKGIDLKMSKAVDLAESSIAQTFADRPLVEASIRDTLGLTYLYLGKPTLAIRQHEKEWKLYQAERGADHPDTLRSLNHLAMAYHDAGQLRKAVQLMEQTLPKHKAALGEDHPETLGSMNNLARAYLAAGQTNKAVSLLEHLLAKRKATLGENHPDTLTSISDLAAAYRDAGQTNKSVSLLEQTLAKQKARLGEDHPDTLHTLNNLALEYQHAGKLDKALPLFEQTLTKRKAVLGEDHPDTLGTMTNLASAYLDAGRTVKARALMEQTLTKQKIVLGEDHPATLDNENNLAAAYGAAGQMDKALALIEQTLARQKAALGEDHPATLTSMNNLAVAYKKARKLDKAIPLYEQTLAKQKAALGPDHPDTLRTMNNLAGAYMAGRQLRKATPLLEQTLARRKATLGENHPATLTSMSNLAIAYHAAGQVKKALSLFELVLQMKKAKLAPDHPDLLSAMITLGLAYREAGRLKDAIGLFETALERGRRRPGGLPPQFATLPGGLAETCERAGEFAKAEAIYRNLLTQARQQFGPDDPRTAGAMAQLAANLLKQKKFAEAEPLLLRGYEGLKKSQKQIPPPVRQLRLTESLQRLVQLYDAWGKTDEAVKWRKELDAQGIGNK